MKSVGNVIVRNRVVAELAVVLRSVTAVMRQLRVHWQDKLAQR